MNNFQQAFHGYFSRPALYHDPYSTLGHENNIHQMGGFNLNQGFPLLTQIGVPRPSCYSGSGQFPHRRPEASTSVMAQSASHYGSTICPMCGTSLLPETTCFQNWIPRATPKQRCHSGVKKRLIWTEELEEAFQDGLRRLGPTTTAKPILDFLVARGFRLTRFQVASHLQKDRKRKRNSKKN